MEVDQELSEDSVVAFMGSVKTKAAEKEVLYFQNEFVGSDDLILQDDIFRVLEDI